MVRETVFHKGKAITDLVDLIARLDRGEWVYWHGRPKHPSVISNMTLHCVSQCARIGLLHAAIRRAEEDALSKAVPLKIEE